MSEDKSIINEKYRDRYKPENRDWLAKFIDDQCTSPVTKEKTVKDEDGNETTEVVELKRRVLDLEALFDLAEANHIPAREKYADQADRKNAPGRLRMTIGNMLRAAARKRGGLFDNDGEWNEAGDGFEVNDPLTENPDGTRIAAAKVEEEAA